MHLSTENNKHTEVDHEWDEAVVDDGLDDLSDLKNLLLGFLLHGDYDYELWGWGG